MKKVVPIIIMIISFAVFVFLGIKYSSCELFKYNLMDIITVIFVSFGIYYITKLGEEKKSKNNKVESIIDLINIKLNSTFLSPIEPDKKSQYLLAFKYIDNKINILENMTQHLRCTEEIRDIKVEKDKLDDFITDNIHHGTEYFLDAKVKDKIPNIISNIEIRLDSIILKIYDSKDNIKK
jgi:hypothetical protein